LDSIQSLSCHWQVNIGFNLPCQAVREPIESHLVERLKSPIIVYLKIVGRRKYFVAIDVFGLNGFWSIFLPLRRVGKVLLEVIVIGPKFRRARCLISKTGALTNPKQAEIAGHYSAASNGLKGQDSDIW
jgi:hypothetical protein